MLLMLVAVSFGPSGQAQSPSSAPHDTTSPAASVARVVMLIGFVGIVMPVSGLIVVARIGQFHRASQPRELDRHAYRASVGKMDADTLRAVVTAMPLRDAETDDLPERSAVHLHAQGTLLTTAGAAETRSVSRV